MPPADYLVEVFGSRTVEEDGPSNFKDTATAKDQFKRHSLRAAEETFTLEPLTTLAKEWMLANVDPEAVIAVDTTAYLFDKDHLLVVVAAMNEHGLVRKGPLPTGLRRHHSSPR